MNLVKKEYPLERYVPLENNPYHLGRITITKIKELFHAEIDIIVKESHKIFHHVGQVHNSPEEQDCLDSSVQKLSEFLKGK